jgi:hypothetical protein
MTTLEVAATLETAAITIVISVTIETSMAIVVTTSRESVLAMMTARSTL